MEIKTVYRALAHGNGKTFTEITGRLSADLERKVIRALDTPSRFSAMQGIGDLFFESSGAEQEAVGGVYSMINRLTDESTKGTVKDLKQTGFFVKYGPATGIGLIAIGQIAGVVEDFRNSSVEQQVSQLNYFLDLADSVYHQTADQLKNVSGLAANLKEYIVQQGDSLWKIAESTYNSLGVNPTNTEISNAVNSISKNNELSQSADKLVPGQELDLGYFKDIVAQKKQDLAELVNKTKNHVDWLKEYVTRKGITNYGQMAEKVTALSGGLMVALGYLSRMNSRKG